MGELIARVGLVQLLLENKVETLLRSVRRGSLGEVCVYLAKVSDFAKQRAWNVFL